MSTRRSIDIEGFNHAGLPIPAASRVGPLPVTSGVHGMDPAPGRLPQDVQQQTKQMFDNLRQGMRAAGDVPEARAAVNEEWVRAFPDPA